MKKFILILIFSILLFSLNSCSYTLLKPTVINNGDINNYTHICVQPTQTLSSGTGTTGYYGNYYSQNKSINPSDVISGILAKKGLIKLAEIDQDLINRTLIISYGESGRRTVGLGGYTIEVTIQFISADSNILVSSCTAEGIGSTEADDLRIAINRCLNSIYGD